MEMMHVSCIRACYARKSHNHLYEETFGYAYLFFFLSCTGQLYLEKCQDSEFL